jgi:hypothetical protein
VPYLHEGDASANTSPNVNASGSFGSEMDIRPFPQPRCPALIKRNPERYSATMTKAVGVPNGVTFQRLLIFASKVRQSSAPPFHFAICKFFALVLALSVLFAPGVASAAMAGSPHHDMQMMEAGHCQTPPARSGDHKMAGKSCCIAMCMAVAVAPSTPTQTARPRQQVAQFTPPAVYHGTLSEIATPPPRHA